VALGFFFGIFGLLTAVGVPKLEPGELSHKSPTRSYKSPTVNGPDSSESKARGIGRTKV